MFQRQRERLLAATLLAASTLATAGGLEVALRLGGYVPAADRPQPRTFKARRLALDCYPEDSTRHFPLDLREPATFARYSAEIGPSLSEAVHDTPHCVEARYNEGHFRDREFGPRREGVRRVVALGDSFTEGMGVREQDAWPQALGRRLEVAAPGAFEVLNCGQRGLDFPHLREMFDRLQELEPDVVVYAFVLNDGENDRSFADRYPALGHWIVGQGRPTEPTYGSRLLSFASERWHQARVTRETLRFYHDVYGPANAEGFARTIGHLRHMQRTQRARGGRLVVALWPLLVGLPDHYPFADVHARLREACNAAGIPFLDLREALNPHSDAELIVHPLDRHPDALAHDLVSRQIAGELLAWAVRKGGATAP
jgi:lysophospholipase L1-like esterase